jgi:hypothetical protein
MSTTMRTAHECLSYALKAIGRDEYLEDRATQVTHALTRPEVAGGHDRDGVLLAHAEALCLLAEAVGSKESKRARPKTKAAPVGTTASAGGTDGR